MSDFAPLSTPAPMGPVEEAPTAGMLLRRARQAAGLHTEAVAAALKVPVQKIQALEADRYDLLPDLVFVRALAASMCRTLGVDGQPVLERLPRKTAPRLAHDSERVNAPFRGPHDVAGPGWRDQLMRPPVLAVLALLIAAMVLILLPQSVLDNVAQGVRNRMAETAVPVVIAAPDTAPVVVPVPAPIAEGAAAPADLRPDTAAGDPAVPAVATPATAAPATAVSTAPSSLVTQSAQATVAAAALVPADPPAPEAAAPAAAGVLVFRASGASWVEVRDAQGAVALRRMLAAGETADATGATPLSVTVGKADVTQVQVRGKDFDLAAVARDNVARFLVR